MRPRTPSFMYALPSSNAACSHYVPALWWAPAPELLRSHVVEGFTEHVLSPSTACCISLNTQKE